MENTGEKGRGIIPGTAESKQGESKRPESLRIPAVKYAEDDLIYRSEL